MSEAIICLSLFLVSLAACVWIMSRIIGRKRLFKWQKALIYTGLCLIISIVFFLGYMSIYYHADPAALEYLKSSDTVKVSRMKKGWVFDGPGESAAIVFYPGAKVDSVAYAPLLYRLSENQIDCFLMEMPFHMPLFDVNAASEALAGTAYNKVIMMGHSMGDLYAARYASRHPDEIDGVVLLAGYAIEQIPDSMRVLSVYGENDGVLTRDIYESNRKFWPSDSTEHVIKGGNHAQFGCYGAQNRDGKATVSAETQQGETVQTILSWMEQF